MPLKKAVSKKKVIVIVMVVILLVIVLAFFILKKQQFVFSFFSKLDYSKASKLIDSLRSTTSTNTFKDVELNPFKYNKTNE